MYDFANNRLPHSFDNTFKYNREIQEIRITREADLLQVERGTSTFYQSLPLQFTLCLEQMEAHYAN